MAITKYQRALILVNNIERKYGSIVDCPEDDPDYLKIRNLYPKTKHGEKTYNYKDQIYRLAHEGCTITEIINAVGANSVEVSNFIKQHNIRIKTVFTIRIVEPWGNVYYVNSLTKFIRLVFKRTTTNGEQFLKSRGYKITKGKYRWKFIRNGSYYLPSYLDRPAVKNGINYYIYEDEK